MQSVMQLVDHYLLPLSLWLVMFSMGLSLVPEDFRRVVNNRRAYLLGMLSMLVIVPLVGERCPEIIPTSVDLPAPFSPSRPWIEPRRTDRLTDLSAENRP